jgi:phenylacetate-CoA ligase
MHPLIHRTLYYTLQTLRREPVANVQHELEASQHWPTDRLLELQEQRTRALLHHAVTTVPWYHDAARAAGLGVDDLHTPGAWARMPVLSKATLQAHATEMHSSHPDPAFKSSTSGSSGTPVAVMRSQKAWAHHHANLYRGLRWFGVDMGDPYAYLWGLAFDEEGQEQARRKDLLFNRQRCSAFTLDAPRARAFYDALRRRPVRYLYGYPSAITRFADEVTGQDLDGRALGIKVAVTTAEVLKDDQRERIRAAFGCPVADSYGCAEVGIVGLECEHGHMHVTVESVRVDMLPSEDGRRELLLTDLHNYAQPVLRYQVGDLLEPDPGPCPCGRGLPLLGRVFGRAGDTLVFPDGRRVNANLPSYIFKAHGREGTVREYQFVQFPSGRVELRVRPGPNWVDGIPERLRREVREALGLEVELKSVDSFERRGRGKHRDYIRAEDIGEG